MTKTRQRKQNLLTARTIETAKKPGRYSDGNGLYLVVRPGGSKQWTFLYRREGKLKEMGLGSPSKGVTLAMARSLRDESRAVMAFGGDPLEARRHAEQSAVGTPTFGAYALALVERIEEGFSNPKHRQQWRNTLQTYCDPIWNLPVDHVDTAGVLACLTPIWQTKPETASRVRGRIERVLNAAKAERLRAGENPAAWRGHLDATLPKPGKLTRGHHAALPYTRPPCAGGAGARTGGTDGDADKRGLECPMDGIRPRRGPLDDTAGTNEGAARASGGAVRARARHCQRTLGGAKL
jgi:hypothetical protein